MARGGRVLDVGCGVGAHVIYLASRGFAAFGVDVEPRVAARAAQLTRRFASGGPIACADARRLPFPDRAFAAAFSMGVLEHFSDADLVTALAEQRRVADVVLTILPTRYTALGEGISDERFPSRADLRRVHRDAGLRVREVFGYGSVPGSGKLPHSLLQWLVPEPFLVALERRTGYAMQLAVLAQRA